MVCDRIFVAACNHPFLNFFVIQFLLWVSGDVVFYFLQLIESWPQFAITHEMKYPRPSASASPRANELLSTEVSTVHNRGSFGSLVVSIPKVGRPATLQASRTVRNWGSSVRAWCRLYCTRPADHPRTPDDHVSSSVRSHLKVSGVHCIVESPKGKFVPTCKPLRSIYRLLPSAIQH